MPPTSRSVSSRCEMRVGIGYDSHRFAEEGTRKLILGGVEIPHPRGLAGHSDGDAVAHALIDAILGAAGLGDIGTMFPSSDPRWRDADSLSLLKRAYLKAVAAGHNFVSADITVITEQPRLTRYVDDMREKLAGALVSAASAAGPSWRSRCSWRRARGARCFARAPRPIRGARPRRSSCTGPTASRVTPCISRSRSSTWAPRCS